LSVRRTVVCQSATGALYEGDIVVELAGLLDRVAA
jgi:hypothetical protein